MMKKIWKSVKIWQSYGREFSGSLFLAHPVYPISLHVHMYVCTCMPSNCCFLLSFFTWASVLSQPCRSYSCVTVMFFYETVLWTNKMMMITSRASEFHGNSAAWRRQKRIWTKCVRKGHQRYEKNDNGPSSYGHSVSTYSLLIAV